MRGLQSAPVLFGACTANALECFQGIQSVCKVGSSKVSACLEVRGKPATSKNNMCSREDCAVCWSVCWCAHTHMYVYVYMFFYIYVCGCVCLFLVFSRVSVGVSVGVGVGGVRVLVPLFLVLSMLA